MSEGPILNNPNHIGEKDPACILPAIAQQQDVAYPAMSELYREKAKSFGDIDFYLSESVNRLKRRGRCRRDDETRSKLACPFYSMLQGHAPNPYSSRFFTFATHMPIASDSGFNVVPWA
jgi:hypothetical protein